nr:MAG TPA: hypothetical protein [Caudoviricetes sp.]
MTGHSTERIILRNSKKFSNFIKKFEISLQNVKS